MVFPSGFAAVFDWTENSDSGFVLSGLVAEGNDVERAAAAAGFAERIRTLARSAEPALILEACRKSG